MNIFRFAHMYRTKAWAMRLLAHPSHLRSVSIDPESQRWENSRCFPVKYIAVESLVMFCLSAGKLYGIISADVNRFPTGAQTLSIRIWNDSTALIFTSSPSIHSQERDKDKIHALPLYPKHSRCDDCTNLLGLITERENVRERENHQQIHTYPICEQFAFFLFHNVACISIHPPWSFPYFSVTAYNWNQRH